MIMNKTSSEHHECLRSSNLKDSPQPTQVQKSPPQIQLPYPPRTVPDNTSILNIRSRDGLIPRLDHAFISTPRSNSLWYMNMRGHHVGAGDNSFLRPYDVELQNIVGPAMSVDSDVIIIARCMAIMHPWGGVLSKVIESFTCIQRMESQIKELED
ncbi:hypothetical protein VNO80_19879 [Phaseolus coccineus]|uniref:Uncharacterized protein n=1 Tax=Phaseolus coccineus TaxID=3886 RepID=A0AAN9MLT0_PHACN